MRWLWAAALAVLVAAPSARADQGPALDSPCPPSPEVDMWRVPANERHGQHELTRTTTIVLPAGVASIDVELWGAGGGGGAGSIESISEGGYGGGGGASGAYARATFPAGAARELTVVVGRGGEGGLARQADANGQDGGATAVCSASRTVEVVAGGAGGHAGHANTNGGEGGRPERAAVTEGDALRSAGNAGVAGTAPLFDMRGLGGAGGGAVTGSVRPAAAFGGRGGAGATTALAPGDGARGGDGAAVVRW